MLVTYHGNLIGANAKEFVKHHSVACTIFVIILLYITSGLLGFLTGSIAGLGQMQGAVTTGLVIVLIWMSILYITNKTAKKVTGKSLDERAKERERDILAYNSKIKKIHKEKDDNGYYDDGL